MVHPGCGMWHTEKQHVQPYRPLLEVKDIRRSFYGVTALDRANVAVAAGTITGLTGPNGAGKTTLFNIVTGLLSPHAGWVFFDGQDITGWRPHRLPAAGWYVLSRSLVAFRG